MAPKDILCNDGYNGVGTGTARDDAQEYIRYDLLC